MPKVSTPMTLEERVQGFPLKGNDSGQSVYVIKCVTVGSVESFKGNIPPIWVLEHFLIEKYVQRDWKVDEWRIPFLQYKLQHVSSCLWYFLPFLVHNSLQCNYCSHVKSLVLLTYTTHFCAVLSYSGVYFGVTVGFLLNRSWYLFSMRSVK